MRAASYMRLCFDEVSTNGQEDCTQLIMSNYSRLVFERVAGRENSCVVENMLFVSALKKDGSQHGYKRPHRVLARRIQYGPKLANPLPENLRAKLEEVLRFKEYLRSLPRARPQ